MWPMHPRVNDLTLFLTAELKVSGGEAHRTQLAMAIRGNATDLVCRHLRWHIVLTSYMKDYKGCLCPGTGALISIVRYHLLPNLAPFLSVHHAFGSRFCGFGHARLRSCPASIDSPRQGR